MPIVYDTNLTFWVGTQTETIVLQDTKNERGKVLRVGASVPDLEIRIHASWPALDDTRVHPSRRTSITSEEVAHTASFWIPVVFAPADDPVKVTRVEEESAT